MSLCRVCVCLVTLLSWLTGGVALADGAASPNGSAVQRQRGIPDRGSGQQTTLRALAEEGVEWPFRGIGEEGPMAHLRVTPWSPSEVEALAVATEHFADCILNGKKPVTDGRAGLEVVKVLVASKESLRKKGAPIELDVNF